MTKKAVDFPVERAFKKYGITEGIDTLISEVGEEYYLRFRRLGGIGVKEFGVDLASWYKQHPPAMFVCSAIYKVASQSAEQPEAWRQIQPAERFAIYHPLNPKHPAVTLPEELFNWYDTKAEQVEPNKTPEVTPNIYDITVVDGLADILKFREPRADGQA